MKLVEVVVGKQTSPETQERALAFTRQIGKLPVVVQDSPGFLVNRVLFPYLLDAARALRKRRSAKEIDDALLQWGMPMGPLRLIDEIGVDITVDIANTLEKAMASAIVPRRFCFRCAMRKCSAANRAAVFTNTKASRNRLTSSKVWTQWRIPANDGLSPQIVRRSALRLIYPDGERSGALSGRKSGRDAGGRRLRNDSGNRICPISRRAFTFCGSLRYPKSRCRNGGLQSTMAKNSRHVICCVNTRKTAQRFTRDTRLSTAENEITTRSAGKTDRRRNQRETGEPRRR